MGEIIYWIRVIILCLYSMFLGLLKMIVNFDRVIGGAILLAGVGSILKELYVQGAIFILAGLVVAFVLGKLKGFILEQIEKLQQKRNNN